jgi:hypothetical protein
LYSPLGMIYITAAPSPLAPAIRLVVTYCCSDQFHIFDKSAHFAMPE